MACWEGRDCSLPRKVPEEQDSSMVDTVRTAALSRSAIPPYSNLPPSLRGKLDSSLKHLIMTPEWSSSDVVPKRIRRCPAVP